MGLDGGELVIDGAGRATMLGTLMKGASLEPGGERSPATRGSSADALYAMSIVVSTLNRALLLERAVRSLLAQETSEPLEIVVVDNGSTDDTRRVVAALSADHPQVRYFTEPRLGLSNARNCGIQHASGPIVAFLDDDAEAEPDWAVRLLAVFRDDPSVGAAGGRTLVRWPGSRPGWVTVALESYYGRCDYGDDRRLLRFPEYPYGSNMAIRRALLVELNGFRTDLGARGNNLMGGEETELFDRLSARQVNVVYEPAAVVHHWTPPERVTRRWTLRRAFTHGLTTAAMASAKGRRGRGPWMRSFARALGRASVAGISTLSAFGTARPPAATMSRFAITAYWAGFARGALVRAMAPPYGRRERRRSPLSGEEGR